MKNQSNNHKKIKLTAEEEEMKEFRKFSRRNFTMSDYVKDWNKLDNMKERLGDTQY